MSVSTPRSSGYTAFNESNSFHASNPNPLHQGPSLNTNNYYRGLKFKKDNSLLAPVAFYTGQIHPIFNFRTKYTRKQACEQVISPEELLKIHQEQILEKKKRLSIEKQKDKEENSKALRGVFELIKKDKHIKHPEEIEKRKAYAIANLEQIQAKNNRKLSENEVRRNEYYDFFPFTHGDQVEANQRSLNLKLKGDLQDYLKSVETSPINTSREPIVAIPKFLQTDEYNNIRRTQNQHVEKVMKGALDTYHHELMSKEKEQIRLQREREEQALLDSAYYKKLELIRKKELEDNLFAINDQIEKKTKKKIQDDEEKRKLYNTSLNIQNESPEKIKERKDNYKDNQYYIIDQMEKNDKKFKESFSKERELDEKMLANVENYLSVEDNEAALRETYTKSLNKDIWLKQMEIKELEKDVGKVL